ncbi:ubiquinol oxidase subunit II [Methyloligella sp. 2.7D]|uniref:ubiquinol oxidase subunit II n=1 Tax=unclassified Methyloligella TaxID=2625955 RepID=UPI00157D47FE|nr:ubiquinol oxidase subunit II [Methyloligella sp. GL2]QKP76331.1 ubiquinol oxidase subunit II [Methyloligella sp. GL2]
MSGIFTKLIKQTSSIGASAPRSWRLLPLAATLFLAGCDGMSVMNPAGQIGVEERWIILIATCLMLIVVVPVIGMVFFFAWKYRETNTEAPYAPEWSHSNRIEAVIWLVPCLIIAALAVVTWISSHELDPYKPIASDQPPLQVDVVSLDWKWLFIYPDFGVASVNELAIPENVPVKFHLTSGSVMNSFFIPRLGGQIYTMAGMETQLSLVANETGTFGGISANYSGNGFSHMNFKAHSLTRQGFEAWIEKAKSSSNALNLTAYAELAKPSEDHAVVYYASVAPNLFDSILHKLFVSDGYACLPPDSSLRTAAKEQ